MERGQSVQNELECWMNGLAQAAARCEFLKQMPSDYLAPAVSVSHPGCYIPDRSDLPLLDLARVLVKDASPLVLPEDRETFCEGFLGKKWGEETYRASVDRFIEYWSRSAVTGDSFREMEVIFRGAIVWICEHYQLDQAKYLIRSYDSFYFVIMRMKQSYPMPVG